MSTPATPIVSIAPLIHPSWFSKAVTWVKHEASVVKSSIVWLAGKEPAVAAAIQTLAPTVEDLSNLIAPGTGNIEKHIVEIYSVVAAAVHGAGDAASANGLNVTFDAVLVAEIKAILPAIEKYLSPAASSAPAPKA